VSRITALALDRLTPADDKRILREDGGIVGRVRAGKKGVTVWFRYDTKLAGKKHDYSLGTWPGKSLAEIRAERDRIRTIVADGIDPNDAKKADRIKRQQAVAETIRKADEERIKAMTVQDLFDVWVADGVARQDGNKELKRLFAKDVLPSIGKRPLLELTDKDILTMLRRMRKRDVTRQTVIAYNDVNQMLSWGEKRQPWRGLLADGNPCNLVDVGKLLPADYEEERDRTLSPAEIRELSEIFKRMDTDYANADDRRKATRPIDPRTRIALWLCLGTLCRIGELLMARWEHVNLDEGVWYIPRENVKGRRGKKQEHFVFISDFTKRQFEKLKELTGESEWCFPAKNRKGETTHVCLKSVSKQVGDRQIMFKNRENPLKGRAFDNSLVLASGDNGEWTPHDLRRTGATMMQELGVSLDVIDRCQNHLLAGRVRRVYLRHDYETEKTEAWRQLGNRLDAILAGGAEIVHFRREAG